MELFHGSLCQKKCRGRKRRHKIITEYDGASPEEVEKQVTIPIEDTLDNIEDIDFYYSTSSEGASSVTLRLKPEADVDELKNNTIC